MKKINIIIPIYNESLSILKLLDTIDIIVCENPDYDFQITVVDDGSNDINSTILNKITQRKVKTIVIKFFRNFGKDAAIIAGIKHSNNFDAVIVMDGDSQHPPKYIPKLIEKWNDGSNHVVAVRTINNDKLLINIILSKIFYRLANKALKINIEFNNTDFRLISSKIIKIINSINDKFVVFRVLLDWIDPNKSYIYFEADRREFGETKFNLSKLFSLANSIIIYGSFTPLKLTALLGIFTTIISLIIVFIQLFLYIIYDIIFVSPIFLAITYSSFLCGVLLTALGLLAGYIKMIAIETRKRPIYIIEDIFE